MSAWDDLDEIRVTGLRASGTHGVYEHEHREPQEFVIDLRLGLWLGGAAVSDDLADTLDYAALSADVRRLVVGRHVDLIEALADRLVARCLADRRVRTVEVTIHKPAAAAALGVDDVAVTLRRFAGQDA